MLSDFFRINLPYGIAKNEQGEWMAFNREYKPLGFSVPTINVGHPTDLNLDLPLYAKYGKLTEKYLLKIADDESSINKNEKGEINMIFLYSDKTNPMNTQDEEDWNRYFKKLRILSVLKKKN